MHKLMIIVPCYHEEEVLPATIAKLTAVLEELIAARKIDEKSAVLFVDDGSRDKTWEIIAAAHRQDMRIYGLQLAGNVGHQKALLAGIEYAKDLCDMSVTIDADLQDDTAVIGEMIEQFLDGADIVYGVRKDRTADTFFKRFTAQTFYKLMRLLGVNTVYNHADFRLLSRRAMEAVCQYSESNVFLRGLVSRLGYKSAVVQYARKERTAGKSKYPLKKMVSFAWDGITSFSIKPIHLVTYLGALIIICAVLALVYTLVSYWRGNVVQGWASIMISIWFLGGVQLFSIGLVGQYVGKTYMESKHRPRYHVAEFLSHEKETEK